MRYINDPRQNRLFDIFDDILSPLAYKELQAGDVKRGHHFPERALVVKCRLVDFLVYAPRRA